MKLFLLDKHRYRILFHLKFIIPKKERVMQRVSLGIKLNSQQVLGVFLLGTVSKDSWLNDTCWTPFTRIWIYSEFKCGTKSCLNDNSFSNSSPWLGKMSVSWVLNHLCLVEMMLYCRAGREGRHLKTNPKQWNKCYWWLSGSLFSLLRPKLWFCKSQRTAEHAVTMSLTEYQELASKLTCCILNSPLSHNRKESLVAFLWS